MSDEPLYDPDGTPFDELDLDNSAVVDAYLSHPNTDKMVDDLSREFRRKPAATQQREISAFVAECEHRRDEALTQLEGFDPDAPERATVQLLVNALNAHIEAAKLRMIELD